MQGDQKQEVAKAEGSYLEQITWEGDSAPIWNINEDLGRMTWAEIDSVVLQSDTSER